MKTRLITEGVAYACLPPQFDSWADYLRTQIYSLPVDPVMDEVFRKKYDEFNSLRYRALLPEDPDVLVVRYNLFAPVKEKNPNYGNFSFRFCDKKTGRRQLVPFARFEEFGFDQFAGTCERAEVFSFEKNRKEIDAVMKEASRKFFKRLFEIHHQWSRYRPTLIIAEEDRRQRYKRYLHSEQWALIRKRVCDKYGNLCQECSQLGGLEVHHKTYERIGEERLEDLIPLCPRCHRSLHSGDAVFTQEVAG